MVHEFLKGKEHLEHLGKGGRITLKLILKKEEDACPLESFGSRQGQAAAEHKNDSGL
jgi:hypothetical protein